MNGTRLTVYVAIERAEGDSLQTMPDKDKPVTRARAPTITVDTSNVSTDKQGKSCLYHISR